MNQYKVIVKLILIALAIVIEKAHALEAHTLNNNALKLKAGYAQIDISPKIGATIQVMTGEQKPIKNIIDPLLAKAIYLNDGKTQAVLISLDLIALTAIRQEDLTAKVKALAGINNLILSVTHTHSGILPVSDQNTLAPRLAELIKAAEQNQQAVNIQVASSQYEQAYNRILNDNGTGKTLWTNQNRIATEKADLTLGVINLTALNGKPYITLVNYNAHPVITMNRQAALVSADYPARLAHHIKQNYGSHTFFMLGAAGDINPFDAGISDMGVKPLKVALNSADELGKAIANKVLAMVNNSATIQKPTTIDFNSRNIELEFSSIKHSIKHLLKEGLNTSKLTHQINTLTIGDNIALAFFGGEFFSDFKVQLAQKSPSKHTFFVGYSNGNIGYVPTKQALLLGGYGANKEQLIFAPETGQTLVNEALNLLGSDTKD